eukprot:scaffold21370_cov67-Phaeocystis_antarctica.AAC.15
MSGAAARPKHAAQPSAWRASRRRPGQRAVAPPGRRAVAPPGRRSPPAACVLLSMSSSGVASIESTFPSQPTGGGCG